MIQLLCLYAVVLLHLVNGATCIQLYDLLIHPVGVPSASGYLLSNISIDSTIIESQLSFNEALLTKDMANSPNGWCLSLHSQLGDELTAPGLECFNYFKLIGQFSSIRDLAGELSLALDAEHQIVSANFYPKEKGGLSLSISKSYKLPHPQPRLRLDGKTDATDHVEAPQENTKEKKSKPKAKNLDNDKEDETVLNDDELKDFQEIVKPRGLYSDEKTFIERYWVYIVPPMLVFFVVGNLGGA